jgi:hypothetical protein
VRYPVALLVLLCLGVAGSAAAGRAVSACSGAPAAQVELQETGPSVTAVALKAGQELDFVNETSDSLPLTTDLPDAPAALDPGACAAFVIPAGRYQFTVGYPSGDVSGTVEVAVPALVTISQHASIVYGSRTVLSGTASGPAGEPVVVWARPLDAGEETRIGAVTPVGGAWRLSVAPRVDTRYTAVLADAQDVRILNVQVHLRVRRVGHTITASVVPRLGHSSVLLFQFTPDRLMLWSGFRSARLDASGTATFRNVPKGRYYVSVLGGSLYLDTATEPFGVGR